MNIRSCQQACNVCLFQEIYGCFAANFPNSHQPNLMRFNDRSFPLEYLLLSFVGGILGVTSEGARKVILYSFHDGAKCWKKGSCRLLERIEA